MIKTKILILISILWFSCKSTNNFTGFSYDPPDVTNTIGKKTFAQKVRVIGAGNPKIWVSNEFEGARLSDFYQVNENTFEVLISPENAPINNSPWYAFDIWTDEPRAIYLKLTYTDGRHRYKPKVFVRNGTMSYSHILENVTLDSTKSIATFAISITKNKQRISAQFLDNILFSDLLDEVKTNLPDYVTVDTAGFSNQNRPILELTADETYPNNEAGVLVLLSRQHPPEVSGYRTYQAFWNELISDTELAKEFRSRFIIKAFPIINPDGVVNGHWRHNHKGIDLNRDWENFNQPETKAVKNALLPLKGDPDKTIVYGIDFHSTNENIIYPINEPVITNPDNLTQKWAEMIIVDNPTRSFTTEEFDTSSPISKNWIYHTFGSDAVTFEVDDELSSSESLELGKNTAQSLMKLLLKEWNSVKK